MSTIEILQKISYYKNMADYIRDDDPDSAAEYDYYADFYSAELREEKSL